MAIVALTTWKEFEVRHLKQSGISVGEACLIYAWKPWATDLLIVVQQGVLRHKESCGVRSPTTHGVLLQKESYDIRSLVTQGVLRHKESCGTRSLMALGVLIRKDS